MKCRSSQILKRLQSGHVATILKVNLSDPRVVEIAGMKGVDGIWLCNEHVPSDWLTIENQVRAARVHDIDSLVRVSRGSYSDYVRPLEADATGIIVPHVTSEEEARQIVNWVRFYPLGQRAMDGGNLDGKFCMLPHDEYAEHSNRERVVVLQIESPEGLEQAEKIAAVPGFNGILFGAGDFSHRIGKPGQINAPEVVAARRQVGAVCRRHGKFAMTTQMIEPLSELVTEGYRVMSVGADVIGLGAYIDQRLDLVHRQTGAPMADATKPSKSPYS